jgi:N-acetylglucosamine kinase-like BadF-type ATPase
MTQSTYFLGIDSGGSQTSAILVNHLGEMVGEGKSGGGNIHNIPLPLAFEQIQLAVTQAVSQVPDASNTIVRGCLGLSGFDTALDKQEFEKFLMQQPLYTQTLGATQLYVVNDALLGLPLITQGSVGVVVVSGTGAHVLGRNGALTASAGCWGYALGDQGSGFAFGQKLLQRVLAEFDGRVDKTPLSAAVLRVLQVQNTEDLLPFVYQKNLPVQAIASLTQLLSQEDLMPYMTPYVDALISALIEAFGAVVRRLSFDESLVLPVALVGGVLQQTYVAQQFSNALVQAYPFVAPKIPQKRNVWGAIQLALSIHHRDDLPTQALVMERARG